MAQRKKNLFSLLVILSVSSWHVESAQILGLFSHPGKSHFDFFRPIFLQLAATGHNISIYSYFPNKVPVANYTDYVFEGVPIMTDIVDLKQFVDTNEQLVPYKIPTFFMITSWGLNACEMALNSPHISQLLESNIRYDVVIMEQFNSDCMLAIAHLIGAPVIALSSCAVMPWHLRRMGSPFMASYMPMNFMPYGNQMDFVDRVNNFLHFHIVDWLYNFHTQPATDALVRKRFGQDSRIPPMRELAKRTSLMLINQHASLTGAHPYAPNVIEVGGLQIDEAKPLEPGLEKLLSSSKQGVIYLSWGSMINPSTLPTTKLNELLSCINKLSQYTFLMRWSNDSLPNKPSNLHTAHWLPQRDLLCHPNVKAFITHGGLLGTTEAAYCGVPMLVTPFYGDQFLNSRAIEQRKFGVIVRYKDFTSSRLLQALHTILEPSFNEAVKISSAAFRKRPQDPLRLALWWIEYVIETKGAPLLQSPAKDMNWFIYNSLDIYLFLSFIIALFIYILRFIWKFVSWICYRQNHKHTRSDTNGKNKRD